MKATTIDEINQFLGAKFVDVQEIQAKATLKTMERKIYGSNGLAATLNVELNKMGATISAGVVGNEGASLTDYFAFAKGGFEALNPSYLHRKEKLGLTGGSNFHKLTGDLGKSLLGADYGKAFGTLKPKDIRITTKDGTEAAEFIRRGVTQSQARARSGKFASVLNLQNFEVRFTLFPKLKKGIAPESLLFSGQKSGDPLTKLLNTNKKGGSSGRPYRPVIEPYLQWYQNVKLPRQIKKFFAEN